MLSVIRIFSDHFSTRELRELTQMMLRRKDKIQMTMDHQGASPFVLIIGLIRVDFTGS
jgi:hypothetical protein